MLNTPVFQEWQPIYAEHHIATFPVTPAKIPAVRGYLRIGLRGSRALAAKFPDTTALGFATNRRNGITVLDIDTKDERVLAHSLDRHGATPLIARTGSGKFHAYYRCNGERRQIRPWPGREIDVLGDGGMVIAPPSKLKSGYEFIEGSLADLSRLPVLRNLDARPERIPQGARNNSLWRHCMKAAHHCDSFDDLLDVATTFNDNCLPLMEDREVISVAESAWGYTERGQNRFGQHGAYFPFDEIAALIADQDAFILLAYLRAENGPGAKVWCTNGLAEKFEWPRKRLANARNRLIELGYLELRRYASQGHPAEYRWAK